MSRLWFNMSCEVDPFFATSTFRFDALQFSLGSDDSEGYFEAAEPCSHTSPCQVSVSFSWACISVIFRSVTKGTVTIGNIWSDCSSPDLLCIIFSLTLEPMKLPPVTNMFVGWLKYGISSKSSLSNRMKQRWKSCSNTAESQTIVTWLKKVKRLHNYCPNKCDILIHPHIGKGNWYECLTENHPFFLAMPKCISFRWGEQRNAPHGDPFHLYHKTIQNPRWVSGAYLESLRIIVRDAGCTVHALKDTVDGLGRRNLPSWLRWMCLMRCFPHL